MSCDELYNIAYEYHTTIKDLEIGFGNGFSKQGKRYFDYLLKIRPDFKQWVLETHPSLVLGWDSF